MASPSFQILFWLSVFALFYTFLGYSWVVFLMVCRRPASGGSRLKTSRPPSVSVVLVVADEEKRIAGRLRNLLAAADVPQRFEILVVDDGSTDSTVQEIESLGDSRVRVLCRERRSGKAACLNAGVVAVEGDIIVFADARQTFAPDAVSRLLRHFADPAVGAVSGSLEIESSASSVGGGVDAYWRIEKRLRAMEANWDSCIGCTGAIYAIRRECFRPIPEDTILDDVVIPMQVAVAGRRVLFEPEARAFDPQQLDPERERIRKQRTMAGNYQMLFRYPGWLLPWRNRLWWQLISHKYLRLAGPWLLALALISNAMLVGGALYDVLLAGQCVLYACALAGLAWPRLRWKPVSVPAGFVFLNFMALRGLFYYLRRPGTGVWERAGS